MVSPLDELARRYEQFVAERGWEQFHTPQNLAMALSVEANELLETFLWFNNPTSAEVQADDEVMENVREELADVLIYTLGMANQLDIDLEAAVEEKLDQNEQRFDPEIAREITSQLKKWQ